MGQKPLAVRISPLGINAQEEKWLKDQGCTLAFQGNCCTVSYPSGTTRACLIIPTPHPTVRWYEIIFPNGTQIKQRCVRRRFLGLYFGEGRISELLIGKR